MTRPDAAQPAWGAPRITPGEQWFRANTGVVVTDGHGLVLVIKRPGGEWQYPQGGLDYGEPPLASALRELHEETGLRADDVEVVAEHPEWFAYALPEPSTKHGLGQVQKWFLVRLTGTPDAVTLDPEEAEAAEWVTLVEAAGRCWPVKRPIYERLAADWDAVVGAPTG